LFDLVLLEYPYGAIPDDPAVLMPLVEEFLRPSGQIYPVSYVRGDWFVQLAARSAFTQDFLKLLGKEPSDRRFSPPASLPRPSFPLRGTPIVPLNSGALPDHVPADAAPQIELDTLDARTRKPKRDFVIGDKLEIQLKTDRAIHFELIFAWEDGEKFIIEYDGERLTPGVPKRIGRVGGIDMDEQGKDYLIILACQEPFPRGELLRAEGVPDRIVHRFFDYTRDGQLIRKPPNLTRVVKKTITIITREPPH
jgi:hypothetical protein